ncbi:MAG: DUF523 domain-containing protein [Erysipelotrichaceae bacterium]|nr:DUF523 domain-containing protein [Erysipelotrichaceae bacterium]
MKIGISACLTGDKVRYNGTDKRNSELLKILKGHELIKICPEMTAGFSVPHEPLEIRNGKVYSSSDRDVTKKLNEAARKCLEMIQNCDLVVLKERSPSCGVHLIYDGTFSGKPIEGHGVFTRLCIKNGIPVYSESDIEEIKRKTVGT